MMHLLEYLLCIIFCLAISDCQAPNNYNFKGWLNSATYLSQYMNKTEKPCENFAAHMCGNFANASTDGSYVSWEDERVKVMMAAMKEAVASIDLNDTKMPTYARNVKHFYEKCITTTFDDSTIKDLYAFLSAELGPYPPFQRAGDARTPSPKDLDDIWYLIGKFHSDFGIAFAMKPTVSVDVTHIEIDPYRIDCWDDIDELRNKTIRVAQIINIDMDTWNLENILNETAAFCNDWSSLVGKSDSSRFEGLAKNLSNEFQSNINWDSYFRGLQTEETLKNWYKKDGRVGISRFSITESVSDIFGKHPIRAIKTVMYAQLMHSLLIQYTREGLNKLFWSNRYLYAPEDICMEYVIQHMSPSAARTYFDYINEDILQWRNEILLIQQNVFSAMRLLLNSVDYLTPTSKERINKKIDAIHFSPGIPSWIMDEKKVLATSGHYNESLSLAINSIRRKQELFREEINTLVYPEIEQEDLPSFEVNDFYSATTNDPHVNILLGDNLPPQFSLHQPLAMKYGGIGFSIGHELMHAFDSLGILMGINQDQAILEKDELEMYDKHKACLIEQYSSICYKKLGDCLTGAAALRDNIADIGGLKAAFAAYKFVKGVLGEEPSLPMLTQYSGDQLFFMTFQRYFCSRNLPQGLLGLDHSKIQHEHLWH